jgi:hypothetical protein
MKKCVFFKKMKTRVQVQLRRPRGMARPEYVLVHRRHLQCRQVPGAAQAYNNKDTSKSSTGSCCIPRQVHVHLGPCKKVTSRCSTGLYIL